MNRIELPHRLWRIHGRSCRCAFEVRRNGHNTLRRLSQVTGVYHINTHWERRWEKERERERE